jgi:hypothetical protein
LPATAMSTLNRGNMGDTTLINRAWRLRSSRIVRSTLSASMRCLIFSVKTLFVFLYFARSRACFYASARSLFSCAVIFMPFVLGVRVSLLVFGSS